jgi:hypothetical protein
MALPNLPTDRELSWRTRRQLLDRPAGLGTIDVVRRLVGAQAQVASAAEVAQRPEAPPVPADRLDAERARVRSYLKQVGDA